MTAVRASADQSHIELDLPAESLSASPTKIRQTPGGAFFLLASLQQALQDLPPNEIPFDFRPVTFVAEPDFQVGLASNGFPSVKFSAGSLPSMEFRFSPENTKKLRSDLKSALLVPRASRKAQ